VPPPHMITSRILYLKVFIKKKFIFTIKKQYKKMPETTPDPARDFVINN